MTSKTTIRDGAGTGNIAKVSNFEDIIVGIGDNQTSFRILNATGTAFNFFAPLSGQEFIITSLLISGPEDATINIFEASSPTSSTITRLIYTITFNDSGFFPIIFPFGGFLEVEEGSFVNATTSVTTATMTMIGYFKPIG